jgi:hypothetical protein
MYSYTKALEVIKKLHKDQAQEIKTLRLKLENLQTLKDQAYRVILSSVHDTLPLLYRNSKLVWCYWKHWSLEKCHWQRTSFASCITTPTQESLHLIVCYKEDNVNKGAERTRRPLKQ